MMTETENDIIEQCAQVALTPLTDEQKRALVDGYGSLFPPIAAYKLAQKTIAEAIRALKADSKASSDSPR
jgi:hypothetical protein